MRRIVCIGNRFHDQDAAGPLVYDRLRQMATPAGVEVIDGGLAGLDLLRYLQGTERVIFVDCVQGFGAEPGRIVVLDRHSVAAQAGAGFDHGAGLPYLLRALPAVMPAGMPQVFLVGVERGWAPERLDQAASLALALAVEEP